MDPVVAPDVSVTADLAQILSSLVLSDNKVRSNAESAINERLAQMPDVYLLALTQFAISAETDVMRSLSSIVLRRFFSRSISPSQGANDQGPSSTLYDCISTSTLSAIENLLLQSLPNECSRAVRRASVDAIADLANKAMQRGRHWHDLHAQVFGMARSADEGLRECAFRIFAASCGVLVVGEKMGEDVVATLKGGLEDGESLEVRFEALCACTAYISLPYDLQTHTISTLLMAPMLQTLPSLPKILFSKFVTPMEVLVYTHPILFQPHLTDLLTFLGPFVVRDTGGCETPTEEKPVTEMPSTLGDSMAPRKKGDDAEVSEEARNAALEFMISLSSAKPAMVKNVEGWLAAVIRACLEGMADFGDSGDLDELMEDDPVDDPINDPDSFFQICAEAFDRLSSAMGASITLPLAFERIPSMLTNYNWQYRQAALMAIAAIIGGAYKTCMLLGDDEIRWVHGELEGVINLVVSMFNDSHPRVRHAACYCVGQLCIEPEEMTSNIFGRQFLDVLVPALKALEPRVHAQAAAALSNVCKGLGRETLIPYLDVIVERLLTLLNPPSGGRPKQYVQEQAIATLAIVADTSKINFGKYYSAAMPLLLDVLRNAKGDDYRNLRAKAMECAGLIAIAVGRDIFRADANALAEILSWMQNGSVDPGDALLNGHLIATWAKICQAMGVEFEPYLPFVIPPLISAAKADVSIDDVQPKGVGQEHGLDGSDLYDDTVDIPTSVFEEKCQAFETIAVYCSTLQARFAPFFVQCLELTLPSLRFTYHEGVREACYKLLPMLLYCGKMSNMLTLQMVSASATQLINCIIAETEPSGLVSLFKCFVTSLVAIGGPTALPQELHNSLIEAVKRHLQNFAEERKARAQRPASDYADGFLFMVEIENFALIQMGKLLYFLNPKDPLLGDVWKVQNMGLNPDTTSVDARD